MSTNVGGIDRILRIVVGLALVAWALGLIPGVAASAWGYLGLIPLATAVFSYCPAYSIIGVNTCGTRKA